MLIIARAEETDARYVFEITEKMRDTFPNLSRDTPNTAIIVKHVLDLKRHQVGEILHMASPFTVMKRDKPRRELLLRLGADFNVQRGSRLNNKARGHLFVPDPCVRINATHCIFLRSFSGGSLKFKLDFIGNQVPLLDCTELYQTEDDVYLVEQNMIEETDSRIEKIVTVGGLLRFVTCSIQ